MNRKLIFCGIAVSILSSGAFAQQPPQSVYRKKVASVSARVAGNSSKKTKDGPRTATYSPQSGFIIVNYNVWNEGDFGITSLSWGSNPGNYSFNIRQSIQDSYNDSFNLLASANLPNNIKADLKALLTTSYNANLNYALSLSSSHATIWMTVEAKGQGVTKGGSGVTLNLDVELLPILPWCGSDPQARQFIVNSTKALIAAAIRKQAPPREVIMGFIDSPIKLLASIGFRNIDTLASSAAAVSPLLTNEIRQISMQKRSALSSKEDLSRRAPINPIGAEEGDYLTLVKAEDIEKALKVKYTIDD